MSLLHQGPEDDAFAAMHADAGAEKMKKRIKRLEDLLRRVLGLLKAIRAQWLVKEIEEALNMTHYDEPDQ